ncbi:MAG: PorV/PorQ family protein, partial [Acidimicrobiales bacterium]
RMRKRSLMLAVSLLAVVAGTAGAQAVPLGQRNNTAYGTTSAEFLLIAPTARGAALGEAFAALTTDISSLYYNPAGLSQMSRPELNASTTSYVASTHYSWVGLAFPFGGGARALGFSVGSFGFSDQPVYTVDDPTGSSGQVYSVAETYVGMTYSQQFSDRFAAGITGKFINDQLGGVTGSAFAVDFGTTFHANIGGRGIRAAFTIQNLGTNITHTGQALSVTVNRTPPAGQSDQPQAPVNAALTAKDWPLPVQFRIGLAYDVFATSLSRFSLMGQFTQPNNNEPTFGFGGEYEAKLGGSGFSIAPRASYTYQPANQLTAPTATDADFAGFSTALSNGSYGWAYGGGISYRKSPTSFGFSVDYALKSFGLLGNTNVVSVGLTW